MVRQSAAEYLKEILGMEERKMFDAEPNNFNEHITLYDDTTGEYYTVKNPNYYTEEKND